jgi:hypothetical protein
MDPTDIGRCGAYCGIYKWREKTNCPGCQSCNGTLFWEECTIARYSLDKGLKHCGFCPALPCETLQGAFDHPDHGDHGERLANLLAWAGDEEVYIKLRTFPPFRMIPNSNNCCLTFAPHR